MIRGFYSAREGLIAHQEHLNTISNNLANVNTVGFKPMRTSFTDLVYQNLNRQPENEALIGHGVKINKNDVQMAQGPLETTNYPLDVAILEENGFFAVQNPLTGDIYYTRAGNFQMSNDDDTFYLVTGTGDRVLDEDGAEIELEWDDEGMLDFDPAIIGVYRFDNPYGLSLLGDNRFEETEFSGEAEAIEEPKIKVGFLEGSGVDLSGTMVDMITASKAFSFSSRMIQVADEVEQTVNSLR